ncbi:MAG: hypothetical protein MJ192_03185 [Clostridia bacterium]|nr:hypothetical protein [Clostridia bacterium]
MARSDRFLITHWCGIPHKFIRKADGTLDLDRFVEMKESGINLMASYDYGYETNCEMLAACEKLDMKVIMCVDRIDRALRDAEHRRELLASVVRDYASYPALLGYHIVDEPNSGAFPALADIRRILKELDPVHESYINLFPNYASLEMLGNPSYYDHVDQYCKLVRPEIVSYDHYHFCKGEPIEQHEITDARERGIYEAAFQKIERPGFFDNIEDVRTACLKHDIPFMVIILVVEHGPYRNLTEAELRWEVFQSLAYGSKRLSYFTYWTPGVDRDEGDDMWHWQNGMITKKGEKTAHYYMIQSINKELQALGDILLGRTSEAVFHIGKVPDTKVTYWTGAYGSVNSLTAENVTAGFFEGGYVLLASKDYENAQTVTLTVPAGRRVRQYAKGEGIWKTLEAADGTYTVALAAGDGELILID